ncbi:MAG: molecular chaperone DnaJ [Candidatus Paceibacteria bacterium]|jgi:molecular chaperone DnaJ
MSNTHTHIYEIIMSKDYYKILDADKSATQDEIKKAFRKIAHKYHPDKKTGDEAKFKEANEAYQVLSDEKKRAQYDQFGSAGPNPFGEQQQGGGQGFGGFDFSGFQQQGGAGGFDFGDIDLGDIFGGGGRRRSRKRRGNDMQMRMEIEFTEAAFGMKKTINVDHAKTCNDCEGTGAEPDSKMETCPECNGQGKVQTQMMGIFATVTECPTCHGHGEVPKDKCRKCKGAGITKEKDTIEFTIPAGIKHGDTLRISGRGEAIKNGQSGDLFIQILTKAHKTFRRSELDLIMEHEIQMSDAVLGTIHKITMLDDTKLEVEVPAGTTHGTTLRVAGKGIITDRIKGNLMITIKIKIPKKLSKKAKEAMEVLQAEGY